MSKWSEISNKKRYRLHRAKSSNGLAWSMVLFGAMLFIAGMAFVALAFGGDK